MGALPKRRISTRRRGKRRAAISINIEKLVKCPSCGKEIKPHFVCSFCGFYAKTSKKTLKK